MLSWSKEKVATRDDPSPVDSPLFEGVEKKLTLRYRCANESKCPSIRTRVEEEFWGRMVQSVGATVLSVVRNEKISAYLLSESSLFVFDDQIILKTCGMTRIFDALGILTGHVQEKVPELELVEIVYSRPTFMFPNLQPGVYGDFAHEASKLRVLADTTIPGTRWKVAQPDVKASPDASASARPCPQPRQPGVTFHCCTLKNTSSKLSWKGGPPSLDVALFFPRPDRMTEFFQLKRVSDPMDSNSSTEEEGTMADLIENPETAGTAALTKCPVAVASGLSQFLPFGSETFQGDEYLFQPCGYSQNAIQDGYYWSIHITPEAKFSYLSFETNSPHCSDLVKSLREFYEPKKLISLTTP